MIASKEGQLVYKRIESEGRLFVYLVDHRHCSNIAGTEKDFFLDWVVVYFDQHQEY